MILYRVFDEVFRSWSHVAVLRALLDTTSGCTGNEVARLSGMHPRSAIKALTSLEQLGIVNRQRGGRDHNFTLNRNHFLVQSVVEPVYKAEQEFYQLIIHALAKKLRRVVLNATIFGSVAKRTETPFSDLDLCCIVKTEEQKESVRNLLNTDAQKLYSIFGVKVAPLFLTLEELKKKNKTHLVRDMLDHGMLVTGKKLKVLLDG
ncbi:MAG: nucleotidyltransferase domain-containing protein [Bacteroidota bacterium]|jgi:predicted nucleotidyltransferase